jgi:hypothetical protein
VDWVFGTILMDYKTNGWVTTGMKHLSVNQESDIFDWRNTGMNATAFCANNLTSNPRTAKVSPWPST